MCDALCWDLIDCVGVKCPDYVPGGPTDCVLAECLDFINAATPATAATPCVTACEDVCRLEG
jgi:hypothetical protein